MWTAAFRYSWRKMKMMAQVELDGDKWSVASAPLGMIGHKSRVSYSPLAIFCMYSFHVLLC